MSFILLCSGVLGMCLPSPHTITSQRGTQATIDMCAPARNCLYAYVFGCGPYGFSLSHPRERPSSMSQHLVHFRCLLGFARRVSQFGSRVAIAVQAAGFEQSSVWHLREIFLCAGGLVLSLPSGRLEVCGSSCFGVPHRVCASGEITPSCVSFRHSMVSHAWAPRAQTPAGSLGPCHQLPPVSHALFIMSAAASPGGFCSHASGRCWKDGDRVPALAWHQERFEEHEGYGDSGAQTSTRRTGWATSWTSSTSLRQAVVPLNSSRLGTDTSRP